MIKITQSLIVNGLLSRLSLEDFGTILPYLELVDLKLHQTLYSINEPADYAYFPVSGICSVIAVDSDNVKAEIGMVGREGFVGASIVLYAGSAPFNVIMQLEGRAFRISRTNLQKVMTSHSGILTMLLKFIHVFGIQTSQTVLANSHYTIQQRLARWLVMCSDRVDGYQFRVTHQFLSEMLSVRRAGITEALNELENRNLIKCPRGNIAILDVRALEAIAKGSYGVPEKAYKKLFDIKKIPRSHGRKRSAH